MTWRYLALLGSVAHAFGGSPAHAAAGEKARLPPLYLDVAAAPCLGRLPLPDLLAQAAAWRVAGLLVPVRSTADGELVAWPPDVTPWMTDCPLDPGQLLAEELVFIDTDAARPGTQPPVLFAELVEAARRVGVRVIPVAMDGAAEAIAGSLIELAREGIGPHAPSAGLMPVEDGRWSDPARVWEDLLFLPAPTAPWRVSDPSVILALAGTVPADGPAAPRDARLVPEPAGAAGAEPAWVDRCRSARTFRRADTDGADRRLAELIALGGRRGSEETAELKLWLRVLLPPDPAARFPEPALLAGTADPDPVVQAWCLAILARIAPDAVAGRLQERIADLAAADAASGPILVWAAGQAGRPELFAPISRFVSQTKVVPSADGASQLLVPTDPTLLAAALGALGRLAAPGGARMIEPWVLDVPEPLRAAAAWCLGSHLPEEDARRALDQLLDAPASHRAAKLAAVRALARVGSPAEVRRLCALLAHPDRGVREMAFACLIRVPPDRLAEPLSVTLAAAAFLPESAMMAALLCGISADRTLLPTVEAARGKAPPDTAPALVALLDWARARITREPVPAAVIGDPAALASGQATHQRIAADLIRAGADAPCLAGSATRTWPGGLAPVAMSLRNPLAATLDLFVQIQVPEGEPWQVIPRERRMALAPGAGEEIVFRLRPGQPAACGMPRMLLRYGQDSQMVREWPLPLPSRCTWSQLAHPPVAPASGAGAGPEADARLDLKMAVRLADPAQAGAEIAIRVAGAGCGTAGALLLSLGDRAAAWPDLWVQTVAADGTAVGAPAPIGRLHGRLRIVGAETRPGAGGLTGIFSLAADSPEALRDGIAADCAYVELDPAGPASGARAVGVWGTPLAYPPPPTCLLPTWGPES